MAFAGHISWRGGDGPRPTANERVLTCGDMLLDAWRMGDGEVWGNGSALPALGPDGLWQAAITGGGALRHWERVFVPCGRGEWSDPAVPVRAGAMDCLCSSCETIHGRGERAVRLLVA